MNRSLAASLVLLIAITGFGCGKSPSNPPAAGESATEADGSPALLTFQRGAMGTRFTIRVWVESSARAEAAQAAADAAFARILDLERIFSDYRADSEIVKLAARPAGMPVPVSRELLAVLDRTQRLSRETGGAFDVTLGPMIRLWRQSRKNTALPTEERLADARARSGWQKVEIDREAPAVTLAMDRMVLDFGGVAKGYAADEALAILRRRGFPRSLVAGSGDIALGDPPGGKSGWRIGIRSLDVALAETPEDLSGTVELANAAISTSGDTEQSIVIGGVRYSHIVDPKTGLGLTERIAVTVIGPDAATTDSLATAVSVLGREKGLALIESKPEVECLIQMAGEGQAVSETRSIGFPAVAGP
ncbi:MAG: FAD:protein FMN transferase [Verrucomicrobiae bacterium]|nr:FAD:protein FMN transferase [Verrucomicrobiae bacterium]